MSLEIAKRIAQLIPSNSVDEIKRLLSPYSLEQRRFIMSTDVSGSSFLYYAVAHRSPLIMKYFLEECEADPNSLGSEQCGKQTCLSKAVSLDSKIMVEILLARGADINGVSFGYETALYTACLMDNLEITKFLVNNGANISIEHSNRNDTVMPFNFDSDHLKYRKVNGANINMLDAQGYTVLIKAVIMGHKEIIYYLLGRQDINIRIKNLNNDDALRVAIRYCPDDITETIIKCGGYTKEEVIKTYEIESLFEYVNRRPSISKKLWEKSLRLQHLPMDTPIFNNLLPNQISDNDINLFREDQRQALLYMRKVYGPRHVLTLQATAIALSFVNVHQNFHEIYDSLSKILHSLECKEFLKVQSHIENALRKYISYFSREEVSIEKLFNMICEYTLIFREKHHQPMSHLIRKFYASKFEDFLHYFIELMHFLINTYQDSIHIISKEIENFLNEHLKNSTRRSLARMCLENKKIRVFEIFLSCGDDIDKTDENDETILHYLLDSKISCKRRLIKSVVDAGFDFRRIASSKYCLPCRMKKEGFLFYPGGCNTLQCLAANVICQKTVSGGTDIAPIFRTIIKKHMHIPYI